MEPARKQALTATQFRSSLGRRPYDLRHATVSLWALLASCHGCGGGRLKRNRRRTRGGLRLAC